MREKKLGKKLEKESEDSLEKVSKEQSWKLMPQNENASFSSNKKNWKECIYLM